MKTIVRQPTRKRVPRFIAVFAVATIALSLLSAIWAIATPVAAAPDEPAHLIKAASVVRGQFVGEYTPGGHIVEVPNYIAFTNVQACYATNSTISAECVPSVKGDPFSLSLATTTAGLYNPVYYLIVGWPSLVVHDESGIFWMRIASGVAGSIFLGLAIALVSTWRRPTIPLLGLIAAVTPMLLFLNGVVNPNGLEASATLATFVAMLTIVRRLDHPRMGALLAILVASATVAANMRGLSLLWVAVAILAPLIFVPKRTLWAFLRRPMVIVAVSVTAATAIFAAAWLLSSNSLLVGVSGGAVPKVPGVGSSPLWGFLYVVIQTFDYAQGIVGIFGWLDTPAPQIVYFTWSVLAGGAFVLAFVFVRGRALWFTMALVASLFLLPPLVQGYYITSGGIIWQGRYILPVFVCAVFAAAVALSDRFALVGLPRRRLIAVVLGLWSLSQMYSFATALRRYVVGLDASWIDMLEPEWSPPGGTIPLLLAFAAVGALSVGALYALLRRSGDDLDLPDPSRTVLR